MAQDNLEPLITQCPNCDTRFRVTEAQLQIAHGRVRCGACLGVFDGAEHLTLDGEDVALDGETDVDALLEELDEIGDEANPVPELGDQDLATRDQSQLVGDDDPQDLPEELLALEAEFMADIRQTDRPALAESADATEAETKELESTETQLTADETNAAETETDTETVQAETVQAETQETTPGSGLAGQEADADEADADADADADWVEDLEVDDWADVGEGGGVEEQVGSAQTATPQMDDDAADQEIELQALPGSEDLVQPNEVSVPLGSDKPAFAAVTAKSEDKAEEPAHVGAGELYEQTPRTRRSWFIYLLLLLGLVALPAQVLWFQYDAWVRNPDYRPVYEWMCGVANCELPPLKDISLVTAKRSIIRAHPEREDARIVDVLMVNNADFAQPFPLIELLATNMRGQLVAGRRFKPSEYLQGDMANAELFPPRTPMHVSLEIQDPGADALNFEVKFR